MQGYTASEQQAEMEWSAQSERDMNDPSRLGKLFMELDADEVELIQARRKAERENARELHGNISINPDWDKREDNDDEHRS